MGISRIKNNVAIQKVLGTFALLAITALLVWVYRKNLPYSFDDSYIHFRIAKHFVETGFPYYNVNEPVMASTSSAWTIILFLLFSMFGARLIPVAILNGIFSVLGAVIYYQIFREHNPQGSKSAFAFLVPVVYLAAIFPASLGLMETAVSMAVCGLALLLFLRKKSISLVLFGSLPFFRPELIFLTGLVAAYAVFRKIFPIQRVLTFLFIGALPFLIYDLAYFRTIIPNSMIAKSRGYGLSLLSTFKNLLTYTFPNIDLPDLFWTVNSSIVSIIFLGVILVMSAALIWRGKIKLDDITLIFLADGLLVCLFYLIGRSKIFQWYPPLFLIPLFMGLFFVFSKGNRFYPWVSMLLVLPLVANMALSIFGVITGRPLYIQYFEQNARVAKYISIGEDLYKKYPKSVLATSEIGGLGWGFEGYIADGFGLASPEAIKYQDGEKNSGTGVIPLGYILALQPDIIVSMDVFDQSFRNSPFASAYNYRAERIYLHTDDIRMREGSLWGSKVIDIYTRKNLPENSAP